MKPFAFIFCGIIAIAARAQEAPQQNASPGGYQTLIAAANSILPGKSGYPSPSPVPEKPLSPRENLRRQRVSVARNAPALALFHRALQLGVAPPSAPPKSGFSPYATKFREMARQLRQESDVRAANGDWNGALQSRLDVVELGAIVTRIGGGLLDDLVGSAIESLGLNSRRPNYDLTPLVFYLDAAQCRAGALRLAKVDQSRISLGAIYQNEAPKTFALIREYVSRPDWATWIQTDKGRNELGLQLTPDDASQLARLSPADFEARIKARFDLAAEKTQQPFAQMVPALTPAPDKMTEFLTASHVGLARASHERPILIARLIQSALELRAIELEGGAFPATFAAPIDPFSGKPLIYSRAGEKYLLYSFGPDGRDDKGRVEIRKRTDFDFDSGTRITSIRRGIEVDAKGDILAPVF